MSCHWICGLSEAGYELNVHGKGEKYVRYYEGTAVPA